MLHHKCTDCLVFGKFKINHINVILSVFLQINLVHVRLFTETCKQTESSYKRYHIFRTFLFTFSTTTFSLLVVKFVWLFRLSTKFLRTYVKRNYCQKKVYLKWTLLNTRLLFLNLKSKEVLMIICGISDLKKNTAANHFHPSVNYTMAYPPLDQMYFVSPN